MTPWFALVIFPPAWLFVLWLLAKASGWSALGERYRHSGMDVGVVQPMKTIYVGLVAYGGLNVACGSEGLQLRQILPFRPFHPPLLIPWQELHFDSVTHIFFRKNLCIKVGDGPTISLYVPFNIFNVEQLKRLGLNGERH